MARDRVYRVMITDPVKRVILSAELDAVGGAKLIRIHPRNLLLLTVLDAGCATGLR